MSAMVDFDDFVALLESGLGLGLGEVSRGALLRDDLGLDSLAMAECLVLLEQHGAQLPDELIPELRTLGDLHHYFTVLGPQPQSAAAPTVGATA